jgi:hypothetical protein
MSLKVIAALLVVVGLSCLIGGFRMEPSASFEGGTFIVTILLIAGGCALCLVGVIMFLVLLFQAL